MENETRIAYWGAVVMVVGLTVLFQTLFMHRTFNPVHGAVESGKIQEESYEGKNAAIQLMQIQNYLDKK